MTRKTRRFAAAALAATAFASVGWGQTTSSWLLPVSGSWVDPTKWSTDPFYPNNGVPIASSYIAHLNATGAPYTVSFNPGDQVAVSTLNISSTDATFDVSGGTFATTNRFTVAGTVNHTGGQINLNTGSLNVGDLHGAGIYNHSGGTLNFGQYFEVGVLVNDAPRYNLSNNGYVSGGTLLVAANFSSGTMTQTGGTVALTTMLDIADGVETSIGHYQFDGGTISIIAPGGGNANAFIGTEGNGTFTQTGGALIIQGSVASSMVLGEAVTTGIPGRGTFNLSGGTVQSPALVAGHFGHGTFIQSGGTHTISGVIRMGRDVGSTGFYQLSGTGALVSNGQVNVGSAGFGTFNQSGGTYTINQGVPLIISANALSRGRYTMSGGTVSGGTLTVNAPGAGAGAFEQSGGTANFNAVNGVGTIAASGTARFTADSIRLGTLTLDNSALVSVRPNGGAARLSTLNFLGISGGGTPTATLDLADNDLKIASGDAATIRSQIAFARHAGAWDRPGITSTSAAAANPKNTSLGMLTGTEYLTANGALFDGQVVLPTDVLVKYTYYGDTDFNGIVNFDDYGRTDQGLLANRTGWLNGDFDYSGAVNFDDYGLIDLAFNTQSGTLIRAMEYLDGRDRSDREMDAPSLQIVMKHLNQFGEPYAQSFLNAVPEPTAGIIISISALSVCLTRRRR